jgi:ABC-2 type transport system permease protein
MINTRLISLIRKEFIQISRDPRTLVIALLIPVMQLFMLGYAATNDVRNLPMAVFDQDRSTAARDFLDAFRATDYFLLSYDVDSQVEIRKLIERGDARVGLIIPPGYGEDIKAERQTQVMFVFMDRMPLQPRRPWLPLSRLATSTQPNSRWRAWREMGWQI